METKLDSKYVKEIKQRGKDSLFFFARGILGFDKLTKEIHRPICESLQDYKSEPRQLVVLPRDWFKSTIVSVAYPIWRAIRNPDVRILVVQNSFSNACKKLQAIKQIFEGHELFRTLYPEILPRSNSTWTKECLTVNRTAAHPEGTFEAAGTGTATTSRNYDLIIEDDTVSPERDALSGLMQQPTQLEIEKAIGWHRLAHPLLLHPAKSQIAVVGTRWAERDLIGWILDNCPEYNVISRAVREDENGNPANRPEGRYIWERYNDEVLDQLERELGPYMFASLMMNLPTDAVNQVFKREWITYYQNHPKEIVCCTSVDPAAAEKEESSDPDYNVVVTTGIAPSTGEIFVLHYTRERMSPGDLISAIFDHYRAYKPVVVKIESIAYQRTLGYWLRKRQNALNLNFYIEELKSLRGSKVDRVRGLQPYFASKKIHIRADMEALERELLAFPKGAHDDIVDALSQQVDFWFDETDKFNEEKVRDERADPMSGRSVIEELRGRAIDKKSYPYDMGLLKERLVGNREPSRSAFKVGALA